MTTWNPLFGTGTRQLQGLARCCDRRGLGFWESFVDVAADVASSVDYSSALDFADDFSDWGGALDFADDFADLATVDYASFDLAPIDFEPALDVIDVMPTLDAADFQPFDMYDGGGLELPADIGGTQIFDDGSTLTTDAAGNVLEATAAPDVLIPAASFTQNIGDVLKVASAPAQSILKALVSQAPAAIQAATSLLKTPAQVNTAKASIARGQLPAGYGLNAQGQLVPLRPSGGKAAPIAQHIANNKTLYIIGGAALVALVLTGNKGARARRKRKAT